MADSSVAITAGSGTSISTRTNASGEHIQVMTLGVDGSDSLVPSSTTGLSVIVQPDTTGGLTIGPASNAKLISAASTNATSVKGSAGQIYGWFLSSTDATPVYVKLYNKATAPTVGSDTPTMVLMVPANGGANAFIPHGIAFGTGIALAITTGAADADTGAVASAEVIVNLLYK